MIVFEDLPSLRRCLELISAEAGAELVRVKNRYSDKYDASESAGYRCARARRCRVSQIEGGGQGGGRRGRQITIFRTIAR